MIFHLPLKTLVVVALVLFATAPPATAFVVADDCLDAITLGVPSSIVDSTTGATLDVAPPCPTAPTAPGVWYGVTGTGNTITATTCNATSGYDTKLSVYRGGCGQLECVVGNDDACAGFSSLLSTVNWCSQLGEEYLILVHGYGTNTGTFQLDITDDGVLCAPPTGACCLPDPCDVGIPWCRVISQAECLALGGIYLGDGTDCGQPFGAPRLYEADPNLPIPDNDPIGVSHTIYVDESCEIGDVDVDVLIDHTWLGDLIITVTHCGVTVSLWVRACGSNDVLDAIFDDEGAAVTCASPTVGHITPISAGGGPLSAFDGMEVSGDWIITVSDNAGQDVGTLLHWSLHIDFLENNPCVTPRGACCFPDGTCEVLSEEQCVMNGGLYQGDFTDCVPNLCQQPCQVECPPEGLPEGEACTEEPFDPFNGGCDSDPPVFSPIHFGETICGESWAAGGMHDTDWYQLNMPTSGEFYWSVEAEFPVEIRVLDGNGGCEAPVVINSTMAFACEPATLTVNVSPGIYWLTVAPLDFSGLSCSAGPWDYTSHGPILANPPDVWIKDCNADVGFTPSTNQCGNTFWVSPDIWIGKNSLCLENDKGSLAYSQNNWFCIKARNRAGSSAANVSVDLYYRNNSTGLNFPSNATWMGSATIAALPLGQTRTVAIQAWVPAAPAQGHWCFGAVLDHTFDHYSANASVPNDNNKACINAAYLLSSGSELVIAGFLAETWEGLGWPGYNMVQMSSDLPPEWGVQLEYAPFGLRQWEPYPPGTLFWLDGTPEDDMPFRLVLTPPPDAPQGYVGMVKVWQEHEAAGLMGGIDFLVRQDDYPPQAITDLTAATVAGAGIELSWSEPMFDVAGFEEMMAYYEVHRSTTAGFAPDPSTLIVTTAIDENEALAGWQYMDDDPALVEGETYYYRVVAVDQADWSSEPSNEAAETYGCVTPAIEWVHSVAVHKTGLGSTAEFFVNLDLANLPATRTSESRDAGIRIIEAQFDRDVLAASLAITGPGGPAGGGAMTLGPGVHGPSSRGRIDLGARLPNDAVYTLTVTADNGPGCALVQELCVSALAGDFNNDGSVLAGDKAEMLGFVFQLITQTNARYDLQTDGGSSGTIEVADLGAWAGFFGTGTTGEPCP